MWRNVDLACGLTLTAIATFFITNSGTGVWDWIFPITLSYVLLGCGLALAALGARALIVARSDGPVGISPLGDADPRPPVRLVTRLVRANPAWTFVAAAIAYVALIPRIGFWVASLLAQIGIGLFLRKEVSFRSFIGVTGFAIVIGATLYYVMSEVFFIPLPRLTQFF